MRPRRWVITAIVSIWASSTLSSAIGADVAERPTRIKVIRVASRKVERTIKLPGTLLPWEEVDVVARTSGYAREVPVDRGSVVAAGAVMLSIEAPELIADLGTARARMSEAASEVARAEAEASLMDLAASRLVQVRKESPDGVPLHAVDEARAKATVARRVVAVSRSREKTAAAAVARAQAMCDLLQVRAPFSGIVTDRWVHAGTFVPLPGASRSESSRLLRLVNTSRLRLALAVPDVESRWISTGTPLRFTTETRPGQRFASNVARLARVLDPVSRVLMVEADVDNSDGVLLAGSFARVELVVEVHEEARVVPQEALVQVRKQPHLAFIEGGKIVRRPVKVGVNTGTVIEVLGLDESGASVPVALGTQVGLQVPDSLVNGTPVTVEEDTPADSTRGRVAP